MPIKKNLSDPELKILSLAAQTKERMISIKVFCLIKKNESVHDLLSR